MAGGSEPLRRRPCLFCADPLAEHFSPGEVPVRVTNVDPPRIEWKPCQPCGGKGWVTLRSVFR